MLQFVQKLRLGSSLTAAELSAVATEIYSQFFAQIATTAKCGKPDDDQKEQQQLKSYAVPCASAFDSQISNQIGSFEPSSDDVWIFGYGSLVWKADFPYIDRRRGYVCGFKRRFYQHSIDHRGVPEKPGRVVTVLPGDEAVDRVYGVAYRIAAAQKREVLDHLDYREKNGYERCNLQFHQYPPSDPSTAIPIEVIMYVATQSNDSYAGDVWQVPRIAEQIFTSAGPSGPNREYLFNLAIAMRELFPGAVDEHLTELVGCVQRYIESDEPALLERALVKEIAGILKECDDNESIGQRLEALRERCKGPGWREKLLAKEMLNTQSDGGSS